MLLLLEEVAEVDEGTAMSVLGEEDGSGVEEVEGGIEEDEEEIEDEVEVGVLLDEEEEDVDCTALRPNPVAVPPS